MNHRGALVSVRCHLWYLNLIRKYLSAENLSHIRRSCFASLFEIKEFEFQGQLYNVMCRHLVSGSAKRMVLQYKIGNHLVEFGPADFALITGLPFNGVITVPERSSFHETVFGGQRYLFLVSIENRFMRECKMTGGNSENSLKLAYLYIVYGLLVLKDRTQKNLDLGYIHLMDDLERFLRYPWGRVAYDFLVPRTYNARRLLLKRETNEKKLTVEAYGFVYALQAWAYEIMPALAAFCGKRVTEQDDRIPRLQRWSADSGFFFDDLWPHFLPSSRTLLVPIIVSAKEYELMEQLGIPSSVHPASPSPVFPKKSLTRKRRLTYDDVEVLDLTEQSKDSPLKHGTTNVGEKKVLPVDPRRSSRLGGKRQNIASKKSISVDDSGENAPASPALSKNTVKDLKCSAEDAHANNAFVILLMELISKVEKLAEKLAMVDAKVDIGNSTLPEVVLEGIRSFFNKQASSQAHKCHGENGMPVQKREEMKSNEDVHVVHGESSTFHNLEPFFPKMGQPQKGPNAVWSFTDLLNEDLLVLNDCNYKVCVKPIPLTDNPVKKSSIDGEARSKSEGHKDTSFFPRATTCCEQASNAIVRNMENLSSFAADLLPSRNIGCSTSYTIPTAENTSKDDNHFDPSDFEFNYSELNPFLRWKEAASGGNRRYDRRLPIKMLRVADHEWFDGILQPNGWLESEHINALMYLLLAEFNKDLVNPVFRDWSCMEMVCWLALRSDDLQEMVGTMMPYVRGTLPFVGGHEWVLARRVFGVAHINNNHWCFYEICIPDQVIVVYDSMNTDWVQVEGHFANVRKNLPILCRLGRLWERCNYSSAIKVSWDVVKFENPPQQTNHSDCGIMAMKYMECCAYGVPIDSIKPERGGIFRRRYVVRLFEASYEA